MKGAKKTLRNDIILIGVILAAALIGFLCFRFTQRDGQTVNVLVDGKVKYTFSLEDTVEKEILSGKNNQNKNVLVIENGKANMKSASCPDKICVDHRKISKSGETIVCLPNRVVVEIE